MNDENLARVLAAIGEQGSMAHSTPSGPILTLFTEFASQAKFRELAEAFALFRKLHRANSTYVQARIPVKVREGFLKGNAIDTTTFMKWSKDNRTEWKKQLEEALELSLNLGDGRDQAAAA